MVDKNKMTELYKNFELKQRDGTGGMKFDYIPSDDIIDRMNRTFNGMWCTEVMSQEITEEAVLVRVRVKIYDTELNEWFYHEGYGAGPIRRHTGGKNVGKVVDAGNAYKSAESMAIRNACSRWGVGLYLDGHEYDLEEQEISDSAQINEEPEIINIVTVAKEEPKVTVYKETGDFPPTVSPQTKVSTLKMPRLPGRPPKIAVKPPEPEPEPAEPEVEEEIVVESVPEPVRAVEEKPTVRMPKLPTPGGALSRAPIRTAERPVSAPTFTIASDDEGKITDVQKAALEATLALKNIEYMVLAREAYELAGWDPNTVPDKDSLTYKQAVVVVKHGNKFYRHS